jgi:hypothetical protein
MAARADDFVMEDVPEVTRDIDMDEDETMASASASASATRTSSKSSTIKRKGRGFQQENRRRDVREDKYDRAAATSDHDTGNAQRCKSICVCVLNHHVENQ